MMFELNNTFLKKAIILFWTLWWLIAFYTDIIGALAHLGWLDATWAPDTNYPFLLSALAIYSLPSWLPGLFYAGIIFWMGLISLFFLWASVSLKQAMLTWMRRAEKAFALSILLWLAFFIADQLVFKFDLEENHMVQGGFQLLSYLALYIL